MCMDLVLALIVAYTRSLIPSNWIQSAHLVFVAFLCLIGTISDLLECSLGDLILTIFWFCDRVHKANEQSTK
jgi:hypothetical protein